VQLTNEFLVAIPVDEAWAVLTDVERIAPCLPGAELQEVVDDEYRGRVKVKVGPVSAEYRGVATFVEQDAVAHRAVLQAEGREARGQGNAKATITATLTPSGDNTQVEVVTDLTISGRVAQFGRGVLADVSTRLLEQFVVCLEQTVQAQSGAAAVGPTEAPAAEPAATAPVAAGEPGEASAPASPVEVTTAAPAPPAAPASVDLDLLKVVGPAIAKRALPVILGALGLWVLWRVVRRRP
jgi:carbon monoxide dehydrogenase subunit G